MQKQFRKTVLKYRWINTGIYFSAIDTGPVFWVTEVDSLTRPVSAEIIFKSAIPVFQDIVEIGGEVFQVAKIVKIDNYIRLSTGHRLPVLGGGEKVGTDVLGMKVC